MSVTESLVGPAVLLPAHPVIAVVGAGSVGGYYGARLAQSGNEVHFLMRSDYQAVRDKGWSIKSRDGDFDLAPGSFGVYDDVRRMPPADLVLVTLKTTSANSYEPLVRPLLKPSTAILSIQNGLGSDEQLGGLFGPSRVLGGLAFVCINRAGPGAIHHIDHGAIRLGELNGGSSPRAEQVAALFRSARMACDVLADLARGRWEKLIWNVPFNGLGAALDLTTDRILATETGRAWVRSLMAEIIDAAKAYAAEPSEPADRTIERLFCATASMGRYRSSMQIDRQEGRELEWEAILNAPLRRAQVKGLPVPYLSHLLDLVKMVNVVS